MNNEKNNLINAIAHNVKFAIKPGNKWIVPKNFEKLLAEKARQILGNQWWDDPLVRERFDAAFEDSYQSYEQLKAPSYEGFGTEAFTFGNMIFGFNKVAQILTRICPSVRFSDNLRVLDLGCGPGTASLSFLHFINLYTNAEVMFSSEEKVRSVSLVQADRCQEMLSMASELTDNFLQKSDRVNATIENKFVIEIGADSSPEEENLLSGGYDIILVQDLLGEMTGCSVSQRSQILCRLYQALNPGGICVAVENVQSRRIQEFHQVVSKAAEGGASLIAPCPALFDNPIGVKCYSCSASSHTSLLRSQFVEKVCKASKLYDFQKMDLQNNWTYAVFQDGWQFVEPHIPQTSTTVLAISRFLSGEIMPGETDRFDIIAAVAECLPDDKRSFRLCDQSCGAETSWVHLEPSVIMPFVEFGDVLILKGVRAVREEIIDEGIVRIHFYADSDTVAENLSSAFRSTTFSEALQETGYDA
jgi:SAM-dependent methyltransferase